MLDHLNWYLVELERRLRKRRTAQDTADFLLETRSHLEERVEDLVSKGMDRASAAKAALADFGDPDSVVRSYSGSMGMSRKAFAFWVVLACIPVALLVGGMSFWLAQQVPFEFSGGSWLLAMPYLAFAIIIGVAWRTRRWIAGYVATFGLGIAVIGSAWVASKIVFIEFRGEQLIVSGANRLDQVAARRAWMDTYEKDFPAIQRWRAARNKPEGDMMLKALIGARDPVAPYRSGWRWSYRDRLLPSEKQTRSLLNQTLSRHDVAAYTLNSLPNFKMAKEMWLAEGDNYAAYLKVVRGDVVEEIRALGNPVPSTWWERWQRVGLPLVVGLALGGLIAMMMNTIVIGLVDLRGHLRRTAWRRQVS